ncbi:MAG: Hint domain-containing protein [Rhodospirillales bacterium]|nr:Hint domain-containing protein [Rhodospirillales bacterium]
MPTNYTWTGASSANWAAAINWQDLPGTNDTGLAPGPTDAAQFIAFSGDVAGAVAADVVYVGPGSNVTLDGSGSFSAVMLGQDNAGNLGDATLRIGSSAGGNVISVTNFYFGSPLGGNDTLLATGTLAVSGVLTIGAGDHPGTVAVNGGGEIAFAQSLSMFDDSSISLAGSGRFVVGSDTVAGTSGALEIEAGANLNGTGSILGNVVDNGGLVTDNFGSPATTLSVSGNVTGSGSLNVNLELDVSGGIGGGIAINLLGGGAGLPGILRLAQPTNEAGTIATFSAGSTLALSGLSFDHVVWQPGSLTMTGASPTLTLATSGDFSHLTFTTQADAISGTDVVVACFAGGTRIRAVAGEREVSRLRVGELVVPMGGAAVPIRWIGRRRLRGGRHPRPWDVWPVRIRAHAFGADQPTRDVRLSPDHGVFIDGVLIPIRHLINGATIVQEEIEAITYWHVELDRHAILFADGLLAESYLDTGNRAAFDNGGGALQLHPDFARRVWESRGCAPLVLDGAALVAARRHMLARARRLGHVLTRDPALQILADGREIAPEVSGLRYRFHLPPAFSSVRLASRRAVPAHLSEGPGDHRRLGVAVARIVMDGTPLALDDARLAAGWHDQEPDGAGAGWRWTDGDAGFATGGARVLDITLAMTARYWLTPATGQVMTPAGARRRH